ncbi:MAG TPA: DUF1236 domain-containing protein [Pseudolabrys sp.]|nr:DUF1236 domain-containing protein [Pseudolabrys sp.]
MRKTLQLLATAAVTVFGAHIALAQGGRTDGAATAPPAAEKNSPADLRGPDGFTPQESSPANGGLNVRSTTGQGAASAPRLSAEQRSKIVGIFREHKVTPAKLDRPVHPGLQIPQDIRFYPLPPDVVEICPQWRDHNFIQVANEILIIDPGTREIVEIIQL